MSQEKISRRDLLKMLAASAGAAALATVPNKWVTPVVEIGALPAHAQTSRSPGAISGTVQLTLNDKPAAGKRPDPVSIFTVSVLTTALTATPTYDHTVGNIDFYIYTVNNVPPGTYTVECTYNCGPSSQDVTSVHVSQGVTTTGVNFSFTACTVCLSGDTQIGTPTGGVGINDIKVGTTVWTRDLTGLRVPGVVLKTQRIPVPTGSTTIHLVLSDGREALVSAQHPLTDGCLISELEVGDPLDGAYVTKAESVPYDEPAKYDLLVSGETSSYWANGIPMNSTIAPVETIQKIVTERMKA